MAVQSLGWGRRGAAGTGVQEQGEAPRPAHQPPGPITFPKKSWKERWSLGLLPPSPNSACMTPKVGLSFPLVSVHLTHREAHQGHQEQGEQGRHGRRPEGRVGVGMWRAVGP